MNPKLQMSQKLYNILYPKSDEDVYHIRFGKTDDGTDKMVEIRTVIVGRGKAANTSIVNMPELARALGRRASYTTKYIGFEVHNPSISDAKTGTYKIRNVHSAAVVGGAVEKFIKKYVVCYFCGCLQTKLVVNMESQTISLKCGDCGLISEVQKDRLMEWIISHLIRIHNTDSDDENDLD